ncbi:MAG: hypothetical protein ACREQ3_23185, partial [Candidatus Binatia bacterium]
MNPEDIWQLVQGRIEQAVESLADATILLATGRSSRSIVNRSYYSITISFPGSAWERNWGRQSHASTAYPGGAWV